MENAININSEVYTIIEELGQGSFGKVFKLEKDNKYYAFKKIPIKDSTKEEISKCTEEAKILSTFDNEFIVKFHYSFLEKDSFNILMEFAGNSNLKQFIQNFKKKNKLIEEKIIKDIIIQICQGLIQIHNSKIIHRDLTPDNIYINENNKIKIGDFGVSKRLNTIQYAHTHTGKLHYNAPEIEKDEKYNNKVDIYALGCIIYELFTLNEYYLDKLDEKDCKINTNIYKTKWQEIIDLLLEKDYNKRPTIEEVYNLIVKKSEIILTINIDKEEDVNNKIYFLDNTENHDYLKEINKANTELYIDDKISEFEKYFIPKNIGIYTIKLKLDFSITDCSYMFFFCKKIKSIDLSSFDTKNVTNMYSMFYECCNLENINLSSINTKNVINMSYMFNHCHNLKSIDLSSFNTQKVKEMNFMFCDCHNLENINLSTFDTKIVNDMECMFGDCNNLKSIDLSNFNTEKVTDMSSMFRNCLKLERIDLSSLSNNFEGTSMFNIFGGCSSLKQIRLRTNLYNKIIKDNPDYIEMNFMKQADIIKNKKDCIIF